MTVLSIDSARELVDRAMRAAGHTPEEAAVIADHLLDCELRGLGFGGLARALSVLERIGPRSPVEVVRESPVSAVLDGGDQVGYLVAARAVEIGLEKARATGIAVVGARNTWYTGMFSYYLERITAAGMAGMIAGSAPAAVAPHGGTEPRWGTNPIAFGFPTTDTPVIWDIGTSAVMYGEVALAARLGEQLPPGRAFGPDGKPTTDPAAALAGAFGVWGGHKGSGLGLVVQLLGMLTGAAADPRGISDCGFLAVLVDPAILADDFPARAAAFAESVRTTRPVEGGTPVRVPFDRSAARRTESLRRNEIEVPQEILDQLCQHADTMAAR
jgi:delta1-piperideine-2-carboxylate reductase